MTKIKQLMQIEGFENLNDFIEERADDSIVPGICTNVECNYTTEVEPDCREGYCEECKTQSVKSALVLLGIM